MEDTEKSVIDSRNISCKIQSSADSNCKRTRQYLLHSGKSSIEVLGPPDQEQQYRRDPAGQEDFLLDHCSI